MCQYWLDKVRKAEAISSRFSVTPSDIVAYPQNATLYKIPVLPWFVAYKLGGGNIFTGTGPELLSWAEELEWKEQTSGQ